MSQYYVESGSLKATVFADDAFDAALESIQCWGGRNDRTEAPTRRMDDEIRVYDRGFRRGEGQRFATISLLAHLHGEPAEQVCQKRVRQFVRRGAVSAN